MASIGKRTLLRDINPHLICLLCRGYLIDATTVVECLHSFCRSCILRHLDTAAAHCPLCKHVINKAKPNIKADKTLQEIVYKLVPGLYHKEMLKRREFYKKHPEEANLATPEQRGEDVSGRLIFNPEDVVSLSLEYLPPGADPLTILSTNDMDTNSNNSNSSNDNSNHNDDIASRRYLQCPALVTVAHLKKFIAMKYSVDLTRYTIEICHRRATLPENWTLMDVAYIYAWKRIAPMRFFYRVAQEEQRLEAPLHQRPSTPGLGARDCLPPNETRNDNNLESNPVNHLETSKLEIKPASNNVETTVSAKDLSKIANDGIISPVNRKQTTTVEKNKTDETTITITPTTSSTLTTINATRMLTTTATNVSSSSETSLSTTCNDLNKQIKSPIKILKNSDGRYEVLKSPSVAAITDVKSPTSPNPEFSVVNSNGVKITLKQCSPPQNNNAKKPKVISNVLLRCGQMEKDTSKLSDTSIIQQLQQQNQDKSITTNPILPNKQEKQRRKVTFMDRSPTSEKTSSTTNVTMPKTVLKKPAEQQDKKQFLQGFQLTAREPSISDDSKLKSSVRDINIAISTVKSLQKNNAISKMEESSKKDSDEIKKKNNIENTGSNANNSTTINMNTKRVAGVPANSRTYTHKTDDADRRACNSGTSLNSINVAGGNHATKTDVYTFSTDPPIVPAGAVKRKCPPGVPIVDLKRRKTSQMVQRQEINKKQNSPYNSVVNKLSRTSSKEHIVPINRAINIDHDAGSSHISSVSNTKASTGPLLSNDTRDLLVDGYGLNIPASLSITLTSPKSPGSSGQFVEPNDSNDSSRKVALGKVNPSITLNDCSVDPRVLKALKTGQIRMPTTPSKTKSTITTTAATTKQIVTTVTTDRGEAANQQRTTLGAKRKKEHESSRDILDLSGGNRKMDIHPLRIPQPVPKLKTNKVTTGRDNMQPGGISDQGQVVVMGGHRYYRAPPGSLTPAAHRVNDCPLSPSPSRTPVYAPSFGGITRPSTDFSSIFPSLPFYALQQAPNLQQFQQMDTARLRLPPRSAVESGTTSAIGSGDNTNSNINSIPGKSHLAAQCAPVKPARSSVAPLAVPINKQQPTEKPINISVNRTVSVDSNKSLAFHNETLESTNETSHVQKRYPLSVESTSNKFLSRNECGKNNDRATNETIRDSGSTESKNETINIDNSMQQQEQHREAMSPNIVSSTASPSPPPGNSVINVRSDGNVNNSDTNINSNDSNGNNNAMPGQTKSISSEVICSKSPDSPDSSSITVENSGTSKDSILTDREMPTDAQTSPNMAKTSESTVNPDNNTVDDSIATDDKNKFADKTEASEIAKQLTSVQKQLLAVLPSTDWANNPIAAEHLGNFFKSLKMDQKTIGNNDNENR